MKSILRLELTPSYYYGFAFAWSVASDFTDPGPWVFAVQRAYNVPDDWDEFSPPLANRYRWQDTTRTLVSKDTVLYFRVRLVTPKGTYYSEPVAPFGTLSRREYLLIKEIMRKETLHARTMAGFLGDFYIRNVYGPRCPVCLDPITGDIRSSNCPACLGTGYVPPYHGPYQMWMTAAGGDAGDATTFSSDGSGTVEPRNITVRTVGSLAIRTGDVLIKPDHDKRYIVKTSDMVAELRDVAVIQSITGSEASKSDPIYRLNIA